MTWAQEFGSVPRGKEGWVRLLQVASVCMGVSRWDCRGGVAGEKAEKPLPTRSHMLYASAPRKRASKNLMDWEMGGARQAGCKSEWSVKRNIEFINVFT